MAQHNELCRAEFSASEHALHLLSCCIPSLCQCVKALSHCQSLQLRLHITEGACTGLDMLTVPAAPAVMHTLSM